MSLFFGGYPVFSGCGRLYVLLRTAKLKHHGKKCHCRGYLLPLQHVSTKLQHVVLQKKTGYNAMLPPYCIAAPIIPKQVAPLHCLCLFHQG